MSHRGGRSSAAAGSSHPCAACDLPGEVFLVHLPRVSCRCSSYSRKRLGLSCSPYDVQRYMGGLAALCHILAPRGFDKIQTIEGTSFFSPDFLPAPILLRRVRICFLATHGSCDCICRERLLVCCGAVRRPRRSLRALICVCFCVPAVPA